MRRALAALLVLAGACTGAPVATQPTPSPSPTPVQTPSPSPSPAPVAFNASRAYKTIARLVRDAPRRESASAAYRVAANIVAGELQRLGYRVRRQSFSVPAGTVDGIAVRAGASQNVVAE